MITTNIPCPNCDSKNIQKNGKTKAGKQKIICLSCNKYLTLNSSWRTEEEKEKILNSYKERVSLRGLRRLYGVSPETVMRWIKKKQELE